MSYSEEKTTSKVSLIMDSNLSSKLSSRNLLFIFKVYTSHPCMSTIHSDRFFVFTFDLLLPGLGFLNILLEEKEGKWC